ncbi:MAG: helicase [Bacteroidetes bacterium]|nr:MAG: helicase [Bacteroidota bacterium]
MYFQNNSQLQLAYNFVQFTGKNIFLTGKAGTGKTTFLHNIKKHSPKRMVVVAPTGVAAINASGVTIHSFFQLSFGPLLPDYKTVTLMNQEKRLNANKFSKEKINIMKSLDLLVIDEISMVRADLLDGIDSTLRRFKNKNLPFGGVQLLMIGDLQQLAPIVKGEEERLLRQYYDTPFFFSSNALQQTQYVSIELKHVYRQKDQNFINLLNKIRDNKIDNNVINKLNERYKPDFNPDNEGYIILTTHNAKAKQINDSKLNRLQEKTYTFEAKVSKNFPEYAYPTDYLLELKVGAQVMFVKNDPNPAKLFYNGKIGTIIDIDDDIIAVDCEGDDQPIEVVPLEWQKMKYSLNKETKEINEIIDGTFTQYPLKLAWAVTIHKAQGLTFEKAIIDAEASFAHGQVYVALSRCKSLEGLVLKTPIAPQSVKHDKTVESFTKNYEENQPDNIELEESKKAFQQQLLTNLFNFDDLQKYIYYSIKILKDNSAALQGNLTELFTEINKNVKPEITDISSKFRTQLKHLFLKNGDVEKNAEIQDRIKKASVYFTDKIKSLIIDKINDVSIETDNKAVKKSVKDILNKLQHEALFKTSCLTACNNGFVVKNYLEIRAKASIDESSLKSSQKKSKKPISTDIVNPELYERLRNWRDAKAEELDKDVYLILQLKTMRELSAKLPVTEFSLSKIKGLGKKKLKLFSRDLIDIIISYCKEKNIEFDAFEEPEIEIKIPKKKSRDISFDLWKQEKTVKEISEERGLTIQTIESHLAYFVGTGELSIDLMVSAEKIKLISNFFETHNTELLGEAKAVLGDDVTYQEILFVLQHLKYIKKN